MVLKQTVVLVNSNLNWFDGIIQVVFHVATMMPLREDNYNSKKNISAMILFLLSAMRVAKNMNLT